ncbi:YeeE/YedE family protein [Paraburkholderia jirisanensis]
MVTSLLIAGCVYLTLTVSGRQAALFGVGVLIGVSLYHGQFSFTSAWRQFIVERRGTGIRSHALLLAVGAVLFAPALAAGTLFGVRVNAAVAPASLSVLIGAFISGVGMQLSSRCACGTLYTATGGSMSMIATLLAFIAGSLLGTAHMPYWSALPSFGALSLGASLGALPALVLSLTVLGAIAALSFAIEQRQYGIEAPPATAQPVYSWLRGPWPLYVGALALAALNFATLALSGHAWRVTSAFALWGAKAAAAAGADVAHWPYWTTGDNAAALAAPLSRDVPSVMNVGIMLGAVLAAALAGRYGPVWRVPLRPLAAAAFGGLLLGYGARLAYGSNVGAYFSGIVSASVHGWIWLFAAFAGSMLGIRIRPLFGLTREDHAAAPDA